MSFFTLIGLAVALAMDAFAVAIASGVSLKFVNGRQMFRLSWHFGLFQALMPILGWIAGLTFAEMIERYDHWVAFCLLAYVGGKMIWEAFAEPDVEQRSDPTKGWTMVVLSVATSIDALAVGLSLAMLQISVWFPALIIGLVAAGFTILGLQLGKTAARAARIGQWAETIGGLVLFGIGFRILFDHGVFG